MKFIGGECGPSGGSLMSKLENLLNQSSTLAKAAIPAIPDPKNSRNSKNSRGSVLDFDIEKARRGATRRDKKRQKRLEPVLKMMDEDDQLRKYYWKTFDDAHPDYVILVFAIRDVGTGEIYISREKYDPFLLMEILDKHQAGGMDS